MNDLIVLDIETSGFDFEKDELKVVGFYKPSTDQYFVYRHCDENRSKIQQLISTHRGIITFNGNKFDQPFMEANGYDFTYKLKLDIYQVFKKREKLIRYEGFRSLKLKNLALDVLNHEEKGVIDYDIFKKHHDEWSIEEKKEIIKYVKQDVKLNWEFWKFLIKHFEPLAELMPLSDVKKYNHIRTTSGSYAYSVICKQIGKEPKFNNVISKPYEGGYVFSPTVDHAHGHIYCLDFNSYYPHAFMQMNLFSSKDGALPCSCCSSEELFRGNKMFPIKGRYCSKTQGVIEKEVSDIYNTRKSLPSNHPLNKPYKIVINTMYGISASPKFHWVYSKHTASDCTLFCRIGIKHAAKVFKDNGYEVLYGDTDSVYIRDPFNDKEKMLSVKDSIILDIKNNVPFPMDTFDMGIDDEIKYIQFFDRKKKHYIYVTTSNKLVVKGIKILKKDCTKLGRKIFYHFLKDKIVDQLSCKFDDDYLYKLIQDEIQKDPTIAAKQFNIRDEYNSKTGIQNQILLMYGKGEQLLIPNYRVGVGKDIRYCTVDEFEQLDIDDVNVLGTLTELSIFAKHGLVKYIVQAKEKKVMDIEQGRLTQWTKN